MLSPEDFEDETNFEEFGNNDAMYSESEIAYGHGPPLEGDDIFELPMARCDCKRYIGPIATKFITRMFARQSEIMSREGRKGRRMTVEEFSQAAGEEMDLLDPALSSLRECCKDAIRLEVGTITQVDHPLSKVVRIALVGEEGGYEGCLKCKRNLGKALGIKREYPKMLWEEVDARLSKSFKTRRTLKACCRTNIIEPITMNWNLDRADDVISSDRRSTVPLKGQRLVEGRVMDDVYTGNVIVRLIPPLRDVETPVDRLPPMRKLNPYTFDERSLAGLFNSDPDSTRSDDLLIIAPSGEGRPVKSSAPAAPGPRDVAWSSLYSIDKSLFPVMPITDEYFVFQEVEYPTGLNAMEQNYRVKGMMLTGLEGYEVPIATGAYLAR